MPLLFTATALFFAVVEISMEVEILTGKNEISSQFDQNDPLVRVLVNWLAFNKLLFIISLVASAISKDPFTRSLLSTGFTVGLSCYYLTLGPALGDAESLEVLVGGIQRTLNFKFAVLIFIFAASAVLEVRAWLSGDPNTSKSKTS